MPTYGRHGLELSVNTAGAQLQNLSRVATFADGGFVVVWETTDAAADGSGGAIKAQRFDSAGAKLGGEFLVNSSFAALQSLAAVTTFADGSFAVAWTTDDPLGDGNGRGIKARLFGASGEPMGAEFVVNTTAAGNQAFPSMVTLTNGNFLVSWTDGYFGEVHARLFTANGTALGADFRLNTFSDGNQSATAISALAGGGFVATWRSTSAVEDSSGEGVRAQLFDSNGAKVGSEFLVNTFKAGHQNDPAVATLAGGGFVVAWVTSQSEDGSGSTLKMQLFSATGAKVGVERQVNTEGFSSQEQPVVAALPDGGFMVAWTNVDTAQDGSGYAIKAQMFDSAGARVGPEFLVNTQTSGNQWNADIATLSDGRVIVTWTDANADGASNWGIKAQIFGPGDPPPPPPPPNWSPSIISDGGGPTATRIVDEKQSLAADVNAWDPDGHAITYSIVGGADAALFAISAETGVLTFLSVPDYEAPIDSGGNNLYEVIVSASDGLLADTQILSIWVGDVDENVAFTSSNNYFKPENSNFPYMLTAVQPANPSAVITYRIAGGSDAALFLLNATTGALTMVSTPDYEAPADYGRDNRYDLIVEATDGFTTATQWLMYHVYDVNESPVITSGGGGATFGLSIAENQSAVTTVSASDPEAPSLAYAIAGGADAARFTINAATGALGFVAAPNFEAPGDSDLNNIYAVIVSASDGARSDTQTIFVTVTNQNESPAITSDGGGSTAAISVVENGLQVTIVKATDPEKSTVVYSIAGGADASRFLIGSATGALSFLANPDFEQPGDSDGNNVYEIIVRASDGALSSFQSIQVGVRDVNEGVTITSGAAASVVENSAAVMNVTAQDLDGDAVGFTVTGGADSALFAVDPETGALRFLAAPDFEAPADADGDNVYEVEVTASDGTLSASKSISVTVANDEEAIAFVSGGGGDEAAVTLNENQGDVLTLLAVDPDGATPHYSIMGGQDAALFYLDPVTRTLRFHSLPALPDFEAPGDHDGDNVYEVIVGANDGQTFDYQTISVTVANVYEGLSFAGPAVSFSAQEGSEEIGAVSVRREAGASVAYSLVGLDSSLFSIDPVTGAIGWVDEPDFERPRDSDGNNVYHFEVVADDGIASDSQAVTVTVGDVDEPVEILSYGGASAVALTMAENIFEVAVVEARDDDGGPVTFAVSGADADAFEIDPNTGALSFLWPNAPDFEDPASVDSDNVYDVTVTASSSTSSATQAFTVTIVDGNEKPWLLQSGYLSVSEGSQIVTTLVGRDPEGAVPTYSIVGGPDAALFAVDPATGLLTFIEARDYETPLSAAGTNVYTVYIGVSDGQTMSWDWFDITVNDVNEPVAITSGGGGETFAVTVDENGTQVASIAASDGDGDVLTYSITGGVDGFRFTIDPGTGALRFAGAPNFEAPADVGADNVYDVVVSVTDGAFTDSQALSVTVGNVDEPVEFVSYGGAATVAVNMLEDDFATGVVVEARGEEGSAVTYSITGGADGHSFEIDPLTGALSFMEPNAPDFEDPTDLDSDNVHEVVVTASTSTSSATQTFMISITNRNEAPSFHYHSSLTVNEGVQAITTLIGRDRDGDSVALAIVGGADAALFVLDPVTNLLKFIQARDFEAPLSAAGTNVYDVEIEASDGQLTTRETLQITIRNVNEAVAITSGGGGEAAAVTVLENGTAVTTIGASDVDGDALTYSITGGADWWRFAIDARTGVLRFVQTQNFEDPWDAGKDHVYDVVVSVTDGALTDSQAIAVTVANVVEQVAITSNSGGDSASVAVAENGTAVTTVVASAPGGDAMTYAIAGGADAARFTINATTGALAFVAAPNFEAPADAGADNVYDVVVSATNGDTVDAQALAVTVGNVNDQMVITSNGGGATAAVTVNENGNVVTTVVGSDPDGAPVTYVILHGGDSGLFTINPTTGVLSFRAAPNFEAPGDSDRDNVYTVRVMASDGLWADDQTLTITVANVVEPVVITSSGGGATGSVAVAENGTAVATVTASNPDGGTLTYAISGGADAARFTINAITGVLAFVAAPNFEAPADAGANNVYDVVVSTTNGSSSDTQALAVTVVNVNEAPIIASAGGGGIGAVSVTENSVAAAIVIAADPDGGSATYSIVGGADAARFTINAQTGALQFVAAPDYELPADSNQDNVYAVVVRASDGQLIDDQALNVTVTNTRDGNNVTGTNGGDSISATSTNVALRTSNEEDLVFGRDGHDTIQGMAGDDELYGEGGNDVLVGGDGADKLLGGVGKDQFTYNAVSESTAALRDLIMDFSRAQGDKISLSAIDSNSLAGGNQAFAFIGSAAFSNVAGQLRYETSGGMTIISGDVNGDGVADLQIQLSGLVQLAASDFVL